ncbi:MAG: F0F1 ATP synthase subunit A [Erysipelotrichia bacterium]|nr:F0F1 ATP synthase subunit A [Erysipelotrichia bacterium]
MNQILEWLFATPLQVEIISIWIVTGLIIGLVFMVHRAVKNADVMAKPTGLVLIGVLIVQTFSNITKDNMGANHYKNYAPYVGALALYLFISNISGLFGLAQPTANYSVTLTLALITFFLIQRAVYRTNGFVKFFTRFFDPHPAFFVMNFFGTIAPLVSMSLRLFGNITGGTIIMMLFYSFSGYIASFVPVIGQFDFIGPLIAPFLHAYFDLFVGFIQMFVFISLTTVFVGNELPSEPETN